MDVELALRVYPPSEVGPLARLGDLAGFDAISVNETARDSIVGASAAALATTRAEIATSVTMAFPRSPTITAMAAWDLQELSGGRFTLGLGPQVKGHIQRRFGIEWTPPVSRMRDYVGALRALWRAFGVGERLDYRTDNYTLTLLTREFNPGPQPYPAPRIHLAAVNPAMCRLAGEVADGLRTHPLMTPKWLAEVAGPAIREGRAKSGRTTPFDLVAASFQAIGTTDEEIEQGLAEARRMLAFYSSTPSYRPVLELHGWADVGEKLTRMVAAGQWDRIPAEIPDAMLETFVVRGKPEELPEIIAGRYGGLATRYSLIFVPASLMHDTDRLAALVQAIRPAPAAAF
jgi:probable F420-dependent oxidoreductase